MTSLSAAIHWCVRVQMQANAAALLTCHVVAGVDGVGGQDEVERALQFLACRFVDVPSLCRQQQCAPQPLADDILRGIDNADIASRNLMVSASIR